MGRRPPTRPKRRRNPGRAPLGPGSGGPAEGGRRRGAGGAGPAERGRWPLWPGLDVEENGTEAVLRGQGGLSSRDSVLLGLRRTPGAVVRRRRARFLVGEDPPDVVLGAQRLTAPKSQVFVTCRQRSIAACHTGRRLARERRSTRQTGRRPAQPASVQCHEPAANAPAPAFENRRAWPRQPTL
jgi:hypothetical protein